MRGDLNLLNRRKAFFNILINPIIFTFSGVDLYIRTYQLQRSSVVKNKFKTILSRLLWNASRCYYLLLLYYKIANKRLGTTYILYAYEIILMIINHKIIIKMFLFCGFLCDIYY